jgi:hypothetical protein
VKKTILLALFMAMTAACGFGTQKWRTETIHEEPGPDGKIKTYRTVQTHKGYSLGGTLPFSFAGGGYQWYLNGGYVGFKPVADANAICNYMPEYCSRMLVTETVTVSGPGPSNASGSSGGGKSEVDARQDKQITALADSHRILLQWADETGVTLDSLVAKDLKGCQEFLAKPENVKDTGEREAYMSYCRAVVDHASRQGSEEN